ncbi:MAG: peptidoglycan binding protein CsiV [Gammaproteobacteria bacterium]|nr:peptidoglycan binding protein CsiV [Gammaproteobacteria bacterium]
MKTAIRQGLMIRALALLALLVSGSAHAQQWYAIEVIVFAESRSGGASDEIIRDVESGPPTGRGASLGPPASSAQQPKAFQRIATGDLQLGGALSKLRGSGRYRPLLHVGWYQPGYDRGNTRPVRLRARGGVIDGIVSVARERYLHLSADLLYSSGVRSRLKQRRRMRSRELHYLEHPRFGMIVQATPFNGPTDGGSSVPPPVPTRVQ